ncbi:hypothetical protein LXL04_020424 [Taraxacum kok-saghyz]
MKKDKSVVTESPSGSGITISSSSNRLFFREEEESERKQTIYDFPLTIVTRNGSSKYDFVKLLCSSQSDLETNLFKVISVRPIFLQYKFLIDLKLELHFWYPFPADEMAGLWAKISSSKSTIGHSCMWDNMCWKVYNCYPTCTKVKLAKCLAGEPFHNSLILSKYLHPYTDMVYELLRTSTEYVTMP